MTRNLMNRFSSAAIFCVLICIGQVFAQSTTTGGISGRVTDPQDRIVPNATVKVTNTGTNSSVTVTADSDGAYSVTGLDPGTYRVEFSSGSFAPSKAENIIVEVGRSTPVDAKLTVGTATAEVVVTAEAPVINTSDNGNSQNFNQTSINEVPNNGRRWSNFALLTPGTVPDGTFGLISFRGITGLLNNNTIDGGDNNQAFFSEERGRTRINYVISQAAVREFQVNTSNYSAEYGRSAGGVTNAVTKSGTNEFHGEVFYYNRNNRNGARNPLAFQSSLVGGVAVRTPAKPPDLRQQFGGTVGGPIIKDKLFFFFSYDQQNRNFPGLAVFSLGTFLNLTSAQMLTLTNPGTGAQGGGANLSTTQVNNTLAFLTNETGQTPRTGNQTLFFPKIDWHINSGNVLSVSYNRLDWKSPNGIQTQAVNTFARSSFGNDFVRVDSLNARLQSNITANILNEFRFQYGRDFESEFSTPPLPGEPPTSSTLVGGVRSPDVFITNGIEFGTPTFLERPKYPDERRYQFADSMTWIMGKHTVKFGTDINYVSDDTVNLRYEAGSYSYGTLADFIIDYSNYLSPNGTALARCSTSPNLPGKCYSGQYLQGIGAPGLKFATIDWNFFVQDDIRVSPRLTVNLGLRYEYLQLPKAMLPFANTTVIPNDGRTIADATSTLPSDTNNFGPRIGFAYDVFGDGKTSFRAGYGIYYGRIQSSTISNALLNTGNPGGQAQIGITATSVSPAAPVFPQVLPANSLTFAAGTINFFSKDFQAPLINQYDVILEHQIMRDTVVSVSYIGSLGRFLPTFVDQNYMQSTTTPTKTFTVYGGALNGTTFVLPNYVRALAPPFGSLSRIESTVSSEYNALVFAGNRRFSDGLQFQASYTLSKSTDTNQNSATFTQTNSPYDLFNRSYDAGYSNFDTRDKFVASVVFSPKLYKGSSRSWASYLVNGWTFSPIYTFYSGHPYDGNVSSSLNGTFGNNRFPLNPRNFYRLPNIINIDARLSKRFRLAESVNLEFLAEAFNIANRTHVFAVNSTLYVKSSNCASTNGIVTSNPNGICFNPAFGTITTTDSTLYRERQIQFSARLQF